MHKFYNPNQPVQQPFCRAFYLHYDDRGELWFVAQREWQQGLNLDCFLDADTTSIREFRASGRNMRFTADRTTGGGNIIESTRVWHDYDGDEIYGDVRINMDINLTDFTITEIASHVPGIGSRDWTAPSGNQTTYRHGDQIGTTRAITNQPTSGDSSIAGRVVYTAFGERVWTDGTVGTRYQYAGEWGYQTFPEHTRQPGDAVPWIHVGHRWYDPATGRFLQRDPIGIRGGLNIYRYSVNNPVSFRDPNGLMTWRARILTITSITAAAIGATCIAHHTMHELGHKAEEAATNWGKRMGATEICRRHANENNEFRRDRMYKVPPDMLPKELRNLSYIVGENGSVLILVQTEDGWGQLRPGNGPELGFP